MTASQALAGWWRRATGRPWKPRIADDGALEGVLRAIAARYRQPAMAAALVQGDAVVAQAAVGVLAHDDRRLVRLDSRFHVGSTTKGMTALVVATLVREGRLRYDDELGGLLPDLPMHDAYRAVTVHDLLVHRAGVMALQDETREDPRVMEHLWSALPARTADAVGQRLEMARVVLALPPIAPPGSKHVYSNVGYALLGLLADRVAGAPFEEVLRTRLFEPLGMATACVGGWPASPEEGEQPRGHFAEDGTLRPQALRDRYVFPAWMNAAGGVHCGIEDYARYARENLRGLKGRSALLGADGFRAIHSVRATASIGDLYGPGLHALTAAYGAGIARQTTSIGYGWVIALTPDGPLSAGDGSGGTFFARIALWPSLDAAFVTATSAGSGAPAASEAIRAVTGLDWA